MFEREDWTLFRNITTLGQKAGVPQDQLASLALKELVDNALDAGSQAVHLEEITLRGRPAFIVVDDGPGIPGTDEEIANLFSIRRPLTSSKLLRLPTRGALGNGLRVVAGVVLASGGTLQVSTRGRTLNLAPRDNGRTGVIDRSPFEQDGTGVMISFGPSLPIPSDVQHLALRAIALGCGTSYDGLSSPWWYDSDSFYELLQAAGTMEMPTLLSFLRGGNKVKRTGPAATLTRQEAWDVLDELRAVSKPVAPTKLGAVGPEGMKHQGYAKKADFFAISPSLGNASAEVPAVVEVWARRLKDKDSTPTAAIYVNRTPVCAPVRSWMRGGQSGEQSIIGCGLNHYFKTGRIPMDIRICVTSPYMPVTTDGKEPNLRPLLGLIAAAVESAVRKAKMAHRESQQEDREYKVSKKDIIFENLNTAIASASGDGAHRFSLRQLYYAMRPILEEHGVEEVDSAYNYFSTVVSDYESWIGHDVPGMYRDTRGALQHPHEMGQMALGTLTVEQYKRPKYRFNKVLYIEKGGFLPLLLDAKWGERHDCALLTSQGFASRAARDLLDMLGDTDEPLEFFCIHDADGPGTMIYEALVEGTRARPGRRVKVTNLGLDPWEAEEMGLTPETVRRKSGSVPVADYVRQYDIDTGEEWAKFLQTGRYELNAMNSPQFLKWLDAKMEEHSSNLKVVPPEHHLQTEFQEKAAQALKAALVEKAIRDLRIDAQVTALLDSLDIPPDLNEILTEQLVGEAVPWSTPLNALVQRKVRLALLPHLGSER